MVTSPNLIREAASGKKIVVPRLKKKRLRGRGGKMQVISAQRRPGTIFNDIADRAELNQRDSGSERGMCYRSSLHVFANRMPSPFHKHALREGSGACRDRDESADANLPTEFLRKQKRKGIAISLSLSQEERQSEICHVAEVIFQPESFISIAFQVSNNNISNAQP